MLVAEDFMEFACLRLGPVDSDRHQEGSQGPFPAAGAPFGAPNVSKHPRKRPVCENMGSQIALQVPLAA